MKIERKKQVLKLLEQHLNTKKSHVESAKSTARGYAEQSIESWSINAFRPAAEAVVDFAKTLLWDAESLQREITASSDQPSVIITPPCFVSVRYNQPAGKTAEFFLVSSNVKLPGVQLITQKSPLGLAVTGKKIGDKFSYQTSEEFSGVIDKIE
ncbi:MAG: GreA/GreB family elongation factor [Patescibacteria group bacterium]|nr:GreA/GreB family elongation factor [Patescibacteria group bacterium]MCL5431777.1 GreA/GreB family elongation factor [Patescibacteria group bacterium]